MLKITLEGEIEDLLRQLSNDSGLAIARIIEQVFLKKTEVYYNTEKKVAIQLDGIKLKSKKEEP
jgi:hypothetical protein